MFERKQCNCATLCLSWKVVTVLLGSQIMWLFWGGKLITMVSLKLPGQCNAVRQSTKNTTVILRKNWCGTGWICTGRCYQLSVKSSTATVHWVYLWCFQSSVTRSQQHQADVSVVQGNCHYLPWVQFLLYTMLPSLSSVWHLGSWRVTTKLTLDPTSAGLSLSSLAVTLPPAEKKIGLRCSKGCIGAEPAINCAPFTLKMFSGLLCF